MTRASCPVSSEKCQCAERQAVVLVGVVALVLILYVFSKQIVTYVESGSYQVKQSWINGKVSAMMAPGWYVKLGDIYTWPIAETFYFTKGRTVSLTLQVITVWSFIQ